MEIIPATKYQGIKLKAGQLLTVFDPEGGQVADLTAIALDDPSEWLSNGRSFDYANKINFSTGDTLYSNRSKPMLLIEEDDVGRHDFLYTPCSKEMYHIQYQVEGNHPNCLDNLRLALEALGQHPLEIPTPFNVFMNVKVSDTGALVLEPPLSKSGDRISFEAKMDLAVAISACPAGKCNGGSQKPIGFSID